MTLHTIALISDKSIDIFKGETTRLNFYMKEYRFKKIISLISFTDLLLKSFKDRLFEVWHIIVAWNQHMKDVFIPLWVSCLYESIYIWNNNLTFPVWMFVTRKTHSKGNKYHAMCCI